MKKSTWKLLIAALLAIASIRFAWADEQCSIVCGVIYDQCDTYCNSRDCPIEPTPGSCCICAIGECVRGCQSEFYSCLNACE